MQASLVEALDLVLARRASGPLPGERRAAGRGAGTELAQIRPYQFGDDVRQIDAAATARTGLPHVRDHVPERTLTTWLLVDVSASMAFGTADRLKSDIAEGVALVIGRLAVRRAGRVALLTCGAPEPQQLPPQRRAAGAGRAAQGAGDAASRRTAHAPRRFARGSACAGSAGSTRGHSLVVVVERLPRGERLAARARGALAAPRRARGRGRRSP